MAPLAFRGRRTWRLLYAVFCKSQLCEKELGVGAEDIELLKLLIPYAYDMNRSAIRCMSACAMHGMLNISIYWDLPGLYAVGGFDAGTNRKCV